MYTAFKKIKLAVSAHLKFFLPVVFCFLLFACDKKDKELYGIYRFYSADKMAMQMMAAQNTYFELSENNTIIYHTEINGKKTFHHQGSFTYSNKSGLLTIKWESGNVASVLKLEKKNDTYIIYTGSSMYKRTHS